MDASVRNKIVAGFASIAIHLVLFVIAFATAPGDLVSSGPPSGSASKATINVMLVSRSITTSSDSSESSALQLLLAEHQTAATYFVPQSPTSGLDNLAGRLRSGEENSEPQPLKERQARIQNDRGASNHAAGSGHSSLDATGQQGTASQSLSTGSLWGRIEPCWRKLKASYRVAVSIEVSLNGIGGLSSPPAIVRPNNVPLDERRLKSEADALAALQACMPRRDPTLANRFYRIDFPAS